MLEMFETEFMQRAWLAGLIVAVICPLIGSFLVLRRQSMIGDGLGHIAFAGVAGGALMGWQPVLSAAAVTVFGALVIEWVRTRLAAFSEMILAIFFYSGIGLAVVFTSMNRMGGFNLSSILFGSLMTISSSDLWIVAGLGIFACIFVVLFYRPLQYLTFDETSARVAGLPADRLNMWLAVLTALTVALSMRIVGLLLVSAMMVIPVACALQTARSFAGTIYGGIAYGLVIVSGGLTLSYYANLAPGGTIVLTGTCMFILSCLFGRRFYQKPQAQENLTAECKICRCRKSRRMQVDLHIHSTASDGTWTPTEVVAAALAAGLGAIAVTDHDSVANVAATHELAVAAELKFIPGTEICSTKDDFCFHILGYGIDVTNKRLLDLLEHNERLLNSKDDESIKMLIERGWLLDFEEFLRYDYDRRRGGWKALAFLQDKGLCGDVNDFFSRIFTKEHDLGFPVFPSIKEVVDAIHAAGGVALCAHAASSFHGPGLAATLLELAKEDFDGFECYHSGHSREDTAALLTYCRQHQLLVSGGSDCHGSFVPSRALGRPVIDSSDLNLPGLL